MSRTVLAVALGALALLTPQASGQDIPAETWARLLVDHPLMASGDRDRVLGSWLDLIEEEPGHPLVEGTLKLIEAQGTVQDDPAAFYARVAELSAEGMDPLAARQHERLTVFTAVRWGPVGQLTPDQLFRSYLGMFEVLGPLGPLGHPLAFTDPPPQLRDPGFLRAHEGVDGDVEWKRVMLEGHRPYVMANTALSTSNGWALVAARFDVPEGGPAWLEIEAEPGGGDSFAFSGATQVPTRGAPSYAFSLNGEEPVIVERLSAESGNVWRQPVTLNVGRNQLVLHGALDTGVAFAVRVLGPDGRVYPGLDQPYFEDPLEATPLGSPVDVAPPSEPLRTSESWLAGHPGLHDSADMLALAGVLAYVDERQAEGLARMRAALDLDPTRIGLRALLARLTQETPYLPEVWRRNRARNLSEQVHAERPDFLSVGLDLARVLSDEDREEESIERLLELTELHPRQSRSLLDLQSVYLKLDMDVAAERALLDAYERTPNNPGVLDRMARRHKAGGRIRAWAETAERTLEARGRTASGLRSLAQQFANEGMTERALWHYGGAVALDGAGHMRLTFGRFLASIERLDLAFDKAESLMHAFPDWAQPHLLVADLFHRQGNAEQELVHLRAALERRPSMREARDRVYEITGEERTEDFFARFLLDADSIREGWDDGASEDSVVKLVDHQIVMVYEDGAAERLTQDVYQARDLAGCEALGEYGVSGEAIEIATIKADGSVFEPVEIGRGYVMPSLEPGDFVVETSRQFQYEPPNGVARMGSWWFASTDQPFEVSRYVISVPHALSLRMEVRNGAQEIERITGEDATIYVFEVRSQPRILPQPGAPPDDWFVPWVEFGMDSDEDTILAQLAAAVLWPTRVTPEIRDATEKTLAEAGDPVGDEARARALHAFTNDTLDQRGGYDATQSLLAREGNAVWLYSALLKAADVPHEIVWSRNVPPDADLEPDAPFVEPGYWSRKLLVLVQPRDGEPAWCDMDIKTMPYGEMMGDAAGAPAVAVPSMRRIALPTLPIEEQPGVHLAMRLALEPDGSAELEGSADIKAGYGFIAKEAIRDIPEAYRSYAINAAVSQLLPGTSVTGFELPGLEVDGERVSVTVTGQVDSLLDDDGVTLGCNLPFPRMELKSNLAGGEGERRLPYLQRGSQIESAIVRMELADGLDVLELPPSLETSYGQSSYRLLVERDGDRAVTIRREMVIKPFYIEAGGFAEFAAFCARVDEAERVRLKFTRGPASGDVDQSAEPR